MKIRLASENDAAPLLAIYAQYIDTPVTFENSLPSLAEFKARIAEISSFYPYLVGEESGRIVGYAYARKQASREAYNWNAELSIYLDRAFTARGLGRKLYSALIAILKAQGIKNICGIVTVPNERSERLHLSLGFQRLVTIPECGYKGGKWRDVAWFWQRIAGGETDPAPPIPVGKLSAGAIGKILPYDNGESQAQRG